MESECTEKTQYIKQTNKKGYKRQNKQTNKNHKTPSAEPETRCKGDQRERDQRLVRAKGEIVHHRRYGIYNTNKRE